MLGQTLWLEWFTDNKVPFLTEKQRDEEIKRRYSRTKAKGKPSNKKNIQKEEKQEEEKKEEEEEEEVEKDSVEQDTAAQEEEGGGFSNGDDGEEESEPSPPKKIRKVQGSPELRKDISQPPPPTPTPRTPTATTRVQDKREQLPANNASKQATEQSVEQNLIAGMQAFFDVNLCVSIRGGAVSECCSVVSRFGCVISGATVPLASLVMLAKDVGM